MRCKKKNLVLGIRVQGNKRINDIFENTMSYFSSVYTWENTPK